MQVQRNMEIHSMPVEGKLLTSVSVELIKVSSQVNVIGKCSFSGWEVSGLARMRYKVDCSP
jgi:hypothetical protein